VIFPLPLTPFERYYLSDDSRKYPTTFPVELRFSGPLAREPFLQAIEQAIERHPLFGALLVRSGLTSKWIAGAREPAWVDWTHCSAPIAHPRGEFIDLTVERGMRVWVRASDESARVIFQFHHSCCDGLAATQFLDDVLVLYASAVTDPSQIPALAPVNVERLRDRASVDLSGAQPGFRAFVRDIVITLYVWTRILFRRVAIVAAPIPSAKDPSADSGGDASRSPEILSFEQYQLTVAEAEAYRQAALRQSMAQNDLMIRDLMLAIDDWNRRQCAASRAACRVNVPVNVRGREGADIPASNRLGFAFVTANPTDFGDRDKLLRIVHAQTEQIKQWKLALYFLGGLGLATLFPGAVPASLRWKKSFATVVLSNIGRLMEHSRLPRSEDRLVCGNVILEHITGAPPIRRNTRAALLVGEYGGRTTISLRCEPRLFSPAETRALLNTYVARLRETVAVETSVERVSPESI
jgi:hypothetical protein